MSINTCPGFKAGSFTDSGTQQFGQDIPRVTDTGGKTVTGIGGTEAFKLENPYVYYRIDSLKGLKRCCSHAVSDLDWHADLPVIRRFYARFGHSVNPDEFGPYVGNPAAIIRDGEIVSFAIPLSFREGETEIGGVATVPDEQGKGCCKALISELAFRILQEGKAVTLTTEKTNQRMQKAAESIGMKQQPENR